MSIDNSSALLSIVILHHTVHGSESAKHYGGENTSEGDPRTIPKLCIYDGSSIVTNDRTGIGMPLWEFACEGHVDSIDGIDHDAVVDSISKAKVESIMGIDPMIECADCDLEIGSVSEIPDVLMPVSCPECGQECGPSQSTEKTTEKTTEETENTSESTDKIVAEIDLSRVDSDVLSKIKAIDGSDVLSFDQLLNDDDLSFGSDWRDDVFSVEGKPVTKVFPIRSSQDRIDCINAIAIVLRGDSLSLPNVQKVKIKGRNSQPDQSNDQGSSIITLIRAITGENDRDVDMVVDAFDEPTDQLTDRIYEHNQCPVESRKMIRRIIS